jgi:hypothetical protein
MNNNQYICREFKRFNEMKSYKDLGDLSDNQQEFIDDVNNNYSDLVSEIGTDFGDIIVMLRGKLINHRMYSRLEPLIDKHKLSFGMSYYRGDNRLMLRHFKTGPVSFSSRELWGE